MTAPPGEQDDASTPLTEEERKELIPAYITLRHELNEAEQVSGFIPFQMVMAAMRALRPTYCL